jgi:type IV secretory pathway VirB10-like protein
MKNYRELGVKPRGRREKLIEKTRSLIVALNLGRLRSIFQFHTFQGGQRRSLYNDQTGEKQVFLCFIPSFQWREIVRDSQFESIGKSLLNVTSQPEPVHEKKRVHEPIKPVPASSRRSGRLPGFGTKPILIGDSTNPFIRAACTKIDKKEKNDRDEKEKEKAKPRNKRTKDEQEKEKDENNEDEKDKQEKDEGDKAEKKTKETKEKKKMTTLKKSQSNERRRPDRRRECRLMPRFRSAASGTCAAGRISHTSVTHFRHYHPSPLAVLSSITPPISHVSCSEQSSNSI